MPLSPTPARFSETARAGTRLPMTLGIVLKGTDSAGNPFTEDTRTVVINRSGAKILTSQSLSQGMRLQLTAVHLKRESWATVAWLGEKKGQQQEIGIDLDYVGDFWGVQFPEDAGTALERMRGAQAGRQAEAAAAAGQASFATTEGGAAVPSPAEPPGPAAAGALEPVQATGTAAGPGEESPAKTAASLPAWVQRAFESKGEEPRAHPRGKAGGKPLAAVGDMARTAVGQSLEQVLEKWNRQVEEIFNRSQMEAVEQVQDLLGRVIENCVKELEERAAEVIARHTQNFEQALEQLLQQAEQRLADRVAEYEARLERMPKSSRK